MAMLNNQRVYMIVWDTKGLFECVQCGSNDPVSDVFFLALEVF